MFDTATKGIRQWIVDLFATAIKNTSRPEDRQSTIQWLLKSREILASDLPMAEKLKALNAQINARAAVSAMAASIVDAVKNYRTSKLPWPMKIAMPATLAAIPVVGLHGAGVAAFGSAIGLPVLLLVFLGTAGITSIIETVATNPHSRVGVGLIVAHILQAEATRRATAAFRQRMADEAAAPQAAPMPTDEAAIRATLLAMDPFKFEQHVMSFFEKAGLEAIVTPRSKDYGMDGYVLHPDGLIVVQCKRYAIRHKVGRPALQQFKTVMADGKAVRGFIVTTSSFTTDAIAYATSANGMVLINMDELVRWHRTAPTF
jgi:restriction system protein